jgi:hypothetical protein
MHAKKSALFKKLFANRLSVLNVFSNHQKKNCANSSPSHSFLLNLLSQLSSLLVYLKLVLHLFFIDESGFLLIIYEIVYKKYVFRRGH